MNQMSIGCSRATSMAVVNALVVHLELGHFVSAYEWIKGYALRVPENATVQEHIFFRTNTGARAHAECTVLEKDNHGKNFPIEKIMVRLRSDRFSDVDARFFECLFTKDGIEVLELDKFPF